jgi:hypothetical protein
MATPRAIHKATHKERYLAKKPMPGLLLSLMDAPLPLVDRKAICHYYYWRDDQVCQGIIGGYANKVFWWDA